MDKGKMLNKIEMYNLESTMIMGASKAIMNKYVEVGMMDEMPEELKSFMEYMDVLFKYCERTVDLTVSELKMQVETAEMIEEIKNELEELKKGVNEYVKEDNKRQNNLTNEIGEIKREIRELKQKKTEIKN